MLEITKRVLTLEAEEVMELERIITDSDREGAYHFLKKNIYKKLLLFQENRLKSHLNGHSDPVTTFSKEKE